MASTTTVETPQAMAARKSKTSRKWSEGVLPPEVVDVLVETERLAEEIVINEQQVSSHSAPATDRSITTQQ